ncbi:MAG: GNAT family N-acetyltransferase, partial [Armatimonadetes bacterium]|nr:GNAT family N-acetyltransferase [Armatimonadota bacterium]
MGELIRTVQPEEREEFLRFLERCYGHGRGFFERAYPDRCCAGEDASRTLLVIEKNGQIVSHVGIFEMDVVVGPARFKCGGIGGVATLPEERGHGYMSRLMQEAVRRMREGGWPLSVLWGDRQRYSSFGYESAGLLYVLRVTRRGLGWEKIQPAPIEEPDARDSATVEFLRQAHATMEYRVERPRLDLQVLRPHVRLFTGDDGYLISRRE